MSLLFAKKLPRTLFLLSLFFAMGANADSKQDIAPNELKTQRDQDLQLSLLCKPNDAACRTRLIKLSAAHYKRWRDLKISNYKYTYRDLGHLCEFTTQVFVVNNKPSEAYLIYTVDIFGGDANCGGTGPLHYKIPVKDVFSIDSFFADSLSKKDDVIGLVFDEKTDLPKLENFCLRASPQHIDCDAHRTLVDSFEILPLSGNPHGPTPSTVDHVTQ